MVDQLVNDLIGATGFFAVVLSFVELFPRVDRRIRPFGFALYLSVGLSLIVDFVNHSSFFAVFPHFAYVNDCLEFLMGALVFQYFQRLLFPRGAVPRSSYLLFLPAVVNLGLYLPLLLSSPTFKASHYPIRLLGSVPLGEYYWWINHTSELWLIFCFLLFLVRAFLRPWRRNRRLGQPRRLRGPYRHAFWYSVAWLVVLVLFFLSNFWPTVFSQRLIILTASLLVVTLYFLIRYNEGAIVEISNGANEGRYRRSRLGGVNVEATVERIHFLMENLERYRDIDVSLETVATELKISPHQLSEVLNAHLGVSFTRFVTSYRVQRAQTRLIAEPTSTILDIAFDCGFRSKSAFNSAFVKSVGMSPTQWRKRGPGL